MTKSAIKLCCSLALICAGLSAFTNSANARETSPIQPSEIISRYGPPDKETDSSRERPPPVIITRSLQYSREKVMFIFVPESHADKKPPVRRWKLIAASDLQTQKQIGLAAAEVRLARRTRR